MPEWPWKRWYFFQLKRALGDLKIISSQQLSRGFRHQKVGYIRYDDLAIARMSCKEIDNMLLLGRCREFTKIYILVVVYGICNASWVLRPTIIQFVEAATIDAEAGRSAVIRIFREVIHFEVADYLHSIKATRPPAQRVLGASLL